MTRWTAAPTLVLALLGVAACSNAATPAATSPVSSRSVVTASSTPSTPSAATGIPVKASPAAPPSASAAASESVSAGGYPAAEVCTYLTSQIPTLTAIGTPVGREANLTANLFTFFSDHGIAPDGAQLETATAAQCPAVRSQLLTLTGLTSLAEM